MDFVLWLWALVLACLRLAAAMSTALPKAQASICMCLFVCLHVRHSTDVLVASWAFPNACSTLQLLLLTRAKNFRKEPVTCKILAGVVIICCCVLQPGTQLMSPAAEECAQLALLCITAQQPIIAQLKGRYGFK